MVPSKKPLKSIFHQLSSLEIQYLNMTILIQKKVQTQNFTIPVLMIFLGMKNKLSHVDKKDSKIIQGIV